MTVSKGFTITYWGATGGLTAPLRPEAITDKMTQALHTLLHAGALKELGDKPTEEAVRQCLKQHLPFHLHASYGGNTSCVEIQVEDALLILDAGSGFRELGLELTRRWNAPDYRGERKAHVLFTHSHMDHTYGTP